MINIEIWASGGGTNADKILSYFKNIPHINVVSLGCNRKDAGAFKIAEKHNITSYDFQHDDDRNPYEFLWF